MSAQHVRAGERGDERVRRLRDELLRRRELPQLAVHDHADFVCERRSILVVVRDEQGRQPELAQELLELRRAPPLGVRVECRERLVQQQHAGIARERAGERDALALAARELGRPRVARGARSGSARGTRPRAPCRRTRRSRARSCAGRARTPGRRARRAARPACGRGATRRTRRRRRARSARPPAARGPAIARSTDVLPAPDGPTRATVRSTSSASSSSNERRGRVKSAERVARGRSV